MTEVIEGAEAPVPSEVPFGTNNQESALNPGCENGYNPESVLENLSKIPELAPDVAQKEPSSTHQRPRKSLPQPKEKHSYAFQKAKRRLNWYKKHKLRTVPQDLSEKHRSYLEEAGAFLELPRATTDSLLPIYISLLDDLIPMVDGASVFRDYSNGRSSTYLVRAICLVTCKIEQAASSLTLRSDGPLLKPLDFASELLVGLDAAIKADLEPDKGVKIQILALMHLHNDGLPGTDRSSSYLSQAIAEAWAISLHWNIPGNPDQGQCDFLWWTLRNLDRLNKPVMGAAPFIIDDTDIGIERIIPREDSYRSQVMHVALNLGDLTATATKIYKATSKATADICLDFPSLSQLTMGTYFDHFHRSHRAYLEIWYHVAAMLSCRYSGPGTIHYNRCLASADRTLEIISQLGHESLPSLPLVPYAMSMSTAMIYRALRDDQRDILSASKDLRLCCNALDDFSQQWTSVRCVAKLANRLWEVLTKSMAVNGPPGEDNERPRRTFPSEAETVKAPDTSPTLADQQRTEDSNPNNITSVPVQTDQALQEQQSSQSNQLIEYWPSIDASYIQLDVAFNDVFDYGMPNIFQDPTAWEYADTVNEESPQGSESQFEKNFTWP